MTENQWEEVRALFRAIHSSVAQLAERNGEKVFTLSENKSYRPDFYLIDTDSFIEVKGYWRKANKEKFQLFLSLYKDIKIEVWEKKVLKDLNLI